MRRGVLVLASAILLSGCARSGPQADLNLEEQVLATERAFARTMADRDHEAFRSFLSDEAVFASEEKPLRGREQVASTTLSVAMTLRVTPKHENTGRVGMPLLGRRRVILVRPSPLSVGRGSWRHPELLP